MEDEPVDGAAEDGSTPDDASTPEAETADGSNPDEGEAEGGDEAGDEAGDDEAGSDEGDEPEVEASAVETEDPEDSQEWKNLSKKYSHIKNPRDRRAQIAKVFWEKSNYGRQLRERNEQLEQMLADIQRAKPETPAEPPPPSPDLILAETRLANLQEQAKRIETRRQDAVTAVNDADRELAIANDRLSDISEDASPETKKLAETRVRQAKRDLKAANDSYHLAIDQRNDHQDKIAQAEKDRDFVKKLQERDAQREQNEQAVREQFNETFPVQVDRMIVEAATELGVDVRKDPALRKSLIRDANKTLILELNARGGADLRQVDLAGLVEGAVKGWASDRDLIRRKAFTKTSKEKLSVAGRTTGGKAPTTTVRPAGSNKPVPVSLMGLDQSGGMARARAALVQKYDRR